MAANRTLFENALLADRLKSKEAPCPIHFTFFVKWVGNREFDPSATVKVL
jgi:hypothetical protein